MTNDEVIKDLEAQKGFIDEKINEIKAMKTQMPDAKAVCMRQHAGQCGTCTDSGGWVACG